GCSGSRTAVRVIRRGPARTRSASSRGRRGTASRARSRPARRPGSSPVNRCPRPWSPRSRQVWMTDRLTIRAIETTPVRVPLTRTYRGSTYQMTHRSTLLTRVVTDEGVVGEAYAGDEDAELLAIEAIVHEEIEPALLGEDAFAVERCWELARPATFDILRNRRLGLVATACVDAAVW